MKTAAAVLLALSASAFQAASAQEITVAWRDNLPYNFIEQGAEKGFLLARGKRIFEQAQVPARFTMESPRRIWAKFKAGTPKYCSLGRYRIAEREALMQYSLPIQIDPPRIVVASPQAAEQVQAHATLASLLGDPALTVAVHGSASFGTQIDALLASPNTRVERRTIELPLMTRLLAANRASFAIVDRYAWQYWSTHDPAAKSLVAHEVSDMPAGQKRYLVCSKDIPADVMHRLNTAIRALKIGPQPLTEAELDQ